MPVQMETTTVPRFTETSPTGGEIQRPADARYRDIEVEVPAGDFDTTATRLLDLCRPAVVGDTVHLTGPEEELLRAAALLRENGFDDDEISLTCTTPGSPFSRPGARRVNCCHCRTVFTSEVVVGDQVTCPGCGRGLVVYHHFSRQTASYLAYMPEEES
ncbi:dimethylamine monooxygenase subunit DmmA family protein [Corynebacterium neomassiliense]|uniref:dimethylamine monooxygenase subunit DmmA family protein n=1 Tax=Corynebacterium neomassiliense TaxID=2079482 RepID=UPI0010306CF8|nr:dimethylamine monooxygenase subunit DmmA family protein [Corynebacterium neomassiliense]